MGRRGKPQKQLGEELFVVVTIAADGKAHASTAHATMQQALLAANTLEVPSGGRRELWAVPFRGSIPQMWEHVHPARVAVPGRPPYEKNDLLFWVKDAR